jgi:hypothetical protein
MTSVKRKKLVHIGIWCLVLIGVHDLIGASRKGGYQPVGPLQTVELEKALVGRLPVYGWGIWPRAEKFQEAVQGPNLPTEYVQRMKTWLPRIVSEEFLPDELDPNQWHGIRKLDGCSDFVTGQYKNRAESATVQFRADGLLLGITISSRDFFPNGIAGVTDEETIKAITRLMKYPADKVESITLEKEIEEMGERDNKVFVCHGRVKDKGYDETKPASPDGKNMRTWWNYMPFWISKNKIFICTSMVNWETFPASLDPYVFKF